MTRPLAIVPVHQLRTKHRAGFTLVELLSAMAITSLLMLSLFSMVGQSSTNYRLTTRKVNTLADTRSFLHFFQSDLSARVSDTKFFWQDSGSGSHSIAFVRTAASSANTLGDLETSVYYVAFTADDSKRGSPKIFRRTLNAADTQKLLESGNTAPFPAYDPAVDEVVVYNVLRFEITPQQRSAAGDWQPWLATSNTAPGQLQIVIELTDDFSAQRLMQESDWNRIASATDDNKQREIVKRFTQTISLTP